MPAKTIKTALIGAGRPVTKMMLARRRKPAIWREERDNKWETRAAGRDRPECCRCFTSGLCARYASMAIFKAFTGMRKVNPTALQSMAK